MAVAFRLQIPSNADDALNEVVNLTSFFGPRHFQVPRCNGAGLKRSDQSFENLWDDRG